MLKVGFFPCQQDPPRGERIAQIWNETVVEAQVAEQNGFDSCLLHEHHQQPDGYLPNPLLLAGLIGAKTERLRVGTCALVLPFHHPVHVAEDGAVVDVTTGGRLIFSVGVGYQPHEFALFGIPIAERVSRCEEGIEIIKRSWTEERFSFSGKHFQLQDVLITPKPVQKPRPPIWMGAWTEVGLKRAARLTDGWLADPCQSLPVMKRFAAIYRAEAEKLGKQPFIAIMRDVWLAETMRQAQAESGPIMYFHRFYFRHRAYVQDEYMEGVRSEEEWTFERAMKDRFIVGSPEACLEELKRWQEEMRPDYFVLRMRYPGGPPHAKVVEILRLFGEKVLPYL